MNISFDYKGKHYCLEYSRQTAMDMEAEGFSITDVDVKVMTRSQQLWTGAFKKNHPDADPALVLEMYEKYGNRKKIKDALQTMIIDTYKFLVPEEDEGEDDGDFTVNP